VLLELTTHMINSGAGREAITVPDCRARNGNGWPRRSSARASGADLAPLLAALAAGHAKRRLRRRCSGSGVAVTPGDVFAVMPGQDPGGVRLCLCAEPSQARVERALSTLAHLLHADHAAALPIV